MHSLIPSAVPSGPPTNFQVRADTSRSLVLSWNPPLPQYQNGIVRKYIVTVALNSTHIYLRWDHPPEEFHYGVIRWYQINITEQYTGRVFQEASEETEITIGPLHPHYIYHCAIAAVTVDVGPFSTITVRTEEGGMYQMS